LREGTANIVSSSENSLSLSELVRDFRDALVRVDTGRPTWRSVRTGASYQPGIGPYPETAAMQLISDELKSLKPGTYEDLVLSVPYPSIARQRCDLVLGRPPAWAVEVKLLRLLGDNGKPNDNMLGHILSPYSDHRSALTDVSKLRHSGLDCRLAVLIYGFDYPDWPMDPVIDAFELLSVGLGPRCEASFSGLMHPVQRDGRVFAWEVTRIT
jgi:hypothetical protein